MSRSLEKRLRAAEEAIRKQTAARSCYIEVRDRLAFTKQVAPELGDGARLDTYAGCRVVENPRLEITSILVRPVAELPPPMPRRCPADAPLMPRRHALKPLLIIHSQ